MDDGLNEVGDSSLADETYRSLLADILSARLAGDRSSSNAAWRRNMLFRVLPCATRWDVSKERDYLSETKKAFSQSGSSVSRITLTVSP